MVLSGGTLFAQDVSFSAAVNKNPVGLNDHFSLTLTIRNGKGNIMAPDLSEFTLLYGPGSSTSIQYVNGKKTSSYSYTYTLSPKKTGNFVMGPFEAEINGRKYNSNKINLKVVNEESATVGTQSGGSGQSQGSSKSSASDGDLIIKIVLDKSSVYVGESVLATFILYSRFQALELQEFESPAFNGFWSEELKNTRASWDDKIKLIDGKQYRKATASRSK